MRKRTWLWTNDNWRALWRAATKLSAIAAAVVVLLCFDISLAFNNPGPTDPIASAHCLATGECEGAAESSDHPAGDTIGRPAVGGI